MDSQGAVYNKYKHPLNSPFQTYPLFFSWSICSKVWVYTTLTATHWLKLPFFIPSRFVPKARMIPFELLEMLYGS